jgi:hypothetical protein
MVFRNMQFDNLPTNPYLDIVLNIIRKGTTQSIAKLNVNDNEDLKNQLLADIFNVLGTANEKLWIGVGKENKTKGKQTREDIYFYLNDDNYTRVFYVEGKRLPKYNSYSSEEYVVGTNSFGNPSGGLQRFKKGIHGDPNRIFDNGLIAYVEINTVDYWLKTVNQSIIVNYGRDEVLIEKKYLFREYISLHQFDCESRVSNFHLHHFWIDLTNQ